MAENMHGQVTVREQNVTIPTYSVGKPDKNPMFLEKRVYQGSSGKVYPLPVIDKIYDEKHDEVYRVVYLENEYVRIMILPQLGGRIQRAYDKTNGYDFVYYNEVIKPALVGLTGPWISGGIEFNWPQHHRPTTFSPVDYLIMDNSDGSKTVVCSEVDQMYGTKGEMSFTLYPDKAYLEIKGRLYNRTNIPQTFLWWANPAVAVNDDTQSVFPPDVHAVFDHGKRDVSKFPIATGVYYKYDYGQGVDISRYKNIPVPTSYMCYRSEYNFVGGYDYGKKAGLLHVADHHVSPGKKQWTWGCGDFGQAWDRNLTDENGPYIELMTGVFTDNQPDFTWLKPFEEKTFVQYFMPYKELGYVKNANTEAALNLTKTGETVTVSVYTTSTYENAAVVLTARGKTLYSKTLTLNPEAAFTACVDSDFEETDLTLALFDSDGRQIIDYTPKASKIESLPDPASPAKDPRDIPTVEELYLTGLHIEQYRHATYLAEDYYLEGLRRDPGDIRTNTAYGILLLRRGLFHEGEKYFRKALERMTWRNPNPYSSEAYMYLGLSLWYQDKLDEAYDMFYKATWTAEQQEMSFYYLAAISSKRGDYETAREHIERSLIRNSHNLKARELKCMILMQLGKMDEANAFIRENIALDPFDYTSRFLSAYMNNTGTEDIEALIAGRTPSYIESSIDFADSGLYSLAVWVLEKCPGTSPMVKYYMAYYAACAGIPCDKYLEEAAAGNSLYCFPNKLEDIIVLNNAVKYNSQDGFALYYLGCEYYDKKRYSEAIAHWERAAELIPNFPTVWRNLSLAYFNKTGDREKARAVLEKAFLLDKSDARVFQELDQLHKKIGIDVKTRLSNYDAHTELWHERDELYVEYVTMLNTIGQYSRAYDLIMERKFHPWEGGEGKVTSQYVLSLVQMAKDILPEDAPKAVRLLQKALSYPENLGEGKLIISTDNNIHYYLGLAYKRIGDAALAEKEFMLATAGGKELSGMMYYNDMPADQILYKGLAWRELGNEAEARKCFHKLIDYGEAHYYDHVKIDYFAVSLPDLQLFEDDLSFRNRIHCDYLIALGSAGTGDYGRAKQSIDKVLINDCSHQGAHVLSKMI